MFSPTLNDPLWLICRKTKQKQKINVRFGDKIFNFRLNSVKYLNEEQR